MNEKLDQAIKDLQNGKLIVVTDDVDRENEGDLICASTFATTQNVNFMATYAKGLICMPMSKEIADQLNLTPMVAENTDNHETAFTQSIDFIDTTTGISAIERGMTARAVVSEHAKANDFRRPGHMFPLIAKQAGVLERSGHTEATVDLMKLAGLKECGLCCEIMEKDGSMMRAKAIEAFVKEHHLTHITIQQIKQYRKMHEMYIQCVASPKLPTEFGEFKLYGFQSISTKEEHVALVKGDITGKEHVLCRIHSECLTGDVFHSKRCDCGEQLKKSMQMIEQEGEGIIIYLRQEGRGIGLLNKLKAYELQEHALDTVEANLALGRKEDERDYAFASQILKSFQIKSVSLITNNPDKIKQLQTYGVTVAKRIEIQIQATPFDKAYLKTKKEKMGHLLNI